MYTGLCVFAKLVSGGKKDEVKAIAPTTGAFPPTGYKSGVEPAGDNAIPSIMDDSFDAWSKVPGNMAKFEASLNKL
jgi:hypothetical protein